MANYAREYQELFRGETGANLCLGVKPVIVATGPNAETKKKEELEMKVSRGAFREKVPVSGKESSNGPVGGRG